MGLIYDLTINWLLGFTPLEYAVQNGHLPAVRYLLDHGADLHQERSTLTLLHTAAVHVKCEPTKLESCFPPLATETLLPKNSRRTALCSSRGRSEIVKFLLSKGADVDALSDAGTPLTLASLRGHASILKILLQHNADPNKGNGVFVPLDVALNKSFVSCVKLLVQGGTNVNGDNPLAKAAEKGLTEAIKCLVEAGANPNVIDRFGRLPIELAAEYGTREDVEILFPFTSPISTVANWTVDGIIKHVEMEIKQLEDGSFVKKKMSDLKQQGDEAFKKQDYQNASVFYTQALKMDNFDTKLLSNRSLCLLRMGEGRRAYEDAADCTKLRPKWAKAHYRAGAALMFMKEYDAAYSSLSRALELDPESEEIEKLFWEAMELK
ncbi:unnamed protein product [Triticum turgidum subsp. durum]|uniref:Serine/threonine-protein kinase BSK1-like TPR repeats domain-containing protein n=1 Tax=Triticum turgidum subsp. durum TaxID=4567 RepID=A0A9R0TH53_TRITD|nr:unnamed protein product [Triticum turgidum subsp. durum]